MNRIKLIILSIAALFCGGLRDTFATANTEGVAGTHPDGILSKAADASHATRHLLVKVGSDADHVAKCAAASDEPIGVTDDEPAAAEDLINVKRLGVVKGTVSFIGATAIAADSDLYSDGTGKVVVEPTVAGTYWKVGKSVEIGKYIGTNLYQIEAVHQVPRKLVVLALPGNVNAEISAIALAAETSTNGTAGAAAADLAALAAEAEKIGDDTRDVRAKFATLVTKSEELADDFRALATALASGNTDIKFLAS